MILQVGHLLLEWPGNFGITQQPFVSTPLVTITSPVFSQKLNFLLETHDSFLQVSELEISLHATSRQHIFSGVVLCIKFDSIIKTQKLSTKWPEKWTITKYSVTIICSACTAEHRNIEEWDERPFDKVPSVNVSEARRAANPIELYSRFISEELRYHVILSPCPHILMSSCHHVIVTYFTYKDDHFYIT